MGDFGGVFAGDDEPALHERGENFGVCVVDQKLVEWRATADVAAPRSGFGEAHEYVACDRPLVDAQAFIAVLGEACDCAAHAARLFVGGGRESDSASSFPGADERGRA